MFTDLKIELVLTLRLVFHLALGQAEAFARNVLKLLGLELRAPDESTLSGRGRAFAGHRPRCPVSNGPMHLVLDRTRLKLFGQGEWDAAEQGRTRRLWLKLHVGVDADTGEIAAHMLTDGHVDDAAQVLNLLRQPEGIIGSLIADGGPTGPAPTKLRHSRRRQAPAAGSLPPQQMPVCRKNCEAAHPSLALVCGF